MPRNIFEMHDNAQSKQVARLVILGPMLVQLQLLLNH